MYQRNQNDKRIRPVVKLVPKPDKSVLPPKPDKPIIHRPVKQARPVNLTGFATDHSEGAHRLRKGMKVEFGGRACEVIMVNDSRAVIRPLGKREHSFTPKTGANADKPINFLSPESDVSISPNSEIPIL